MPIVRTELQQNRKLLVKLIKAACQMQDFDEVDRICREASISKAEKVKLLEHAINIYTEYGGKAPGARGNAMRVRGLVNLGNTCFVNSTLQVLASIPSLAQGLLKTYGTQANPQHDVGQAVAETVGQILGVGSDATSLEAIWPTAVIQNFGRIGPHKDYAVGFQNDAHAFLCHLLESLGEENAKMVKRIFGGSARTRIKCQSCGRPGKVQHSNFQNVSLAVDNDSTVDLAIEEFISGAEVQRRCPRLNCQGEDGVQSTTVNKAPNALIVNVKTFEYDRALKIVKRANKRISLDETLELPLSVGKAQYDLTGVIDHDGDSTHSGHYMAYVRTVDGRWFKANDGTVREVNFNTSVKKAKAYVLVYQRRKTPGLWAAIGRFFTRVITAVRDFGESLCHSWV